MPGNLRNSSTNQKVIDSLLDSWAMKRAAGFGSSRFSVLFCAILSTEKAWKASLHIISLKFTGTILKTFGSSSIGTLIFDITL